MPWEGGSSWAHAKKLGFAGVIVEERITRSNANPLTIIDDLLLGGGTKVQDHTLLHGNTSPNTSNSLMLDSMLTSSEVTCLFEKAARAGLAYTA